MIYRVINEHRCHPGGSRPCFIRGFFLVLPALVIMILITELFRKQVRPFDSLAHTFLPLLYVVLPLSLLPFSAFSHTGLKTLLNPWRLQFLSWHILVSWLFCGLMDTGALLSVSLLENTVFMKEYLRGKRGMDLRAVC